MTQRAATTDYLILGGGSAGCVLAARLSEEPRLTVTLVEAGRDLTLDTMPPAIRSRYPGRAYLDTGNIWASLRAYMGQPPGNLDERADRRYEQARLLGGGSAINALLANRGAPSDYDEWEARGATGWSWEDCLPYFLKLERDCDFGGPLHGLDGPLPVRRLTPERLSPFVTRVAETLAAMGHVRRADQNGPWEPGVFAAAAVVGEAGERVPTSVGYLTPAVRRRPNLRIVTGRLAERIVFEGRRAIGAVLRPAEGGEGQETIAAANVVVSSGAIHTPALLMRSGVGPGADLAALAIPVAADRRGVGRNLMEHPSIAVSAYLRPEGRVRDPDEHHEQAILRFSSGLDGTPDGDMHGAILSRSGWHAVGLRLGSLFFWVNKSYSTGAVRLGSADPRIEPLVDFRMLSDWRDLERLKGALRLGAATLTHPMMTAMTDAAFPASYTPRVAAIARPGRGLALQRGTLAGLLDVAGPARRLLIKTVVTGGIGLSDLLADDAALTRYVMTNVGGTWHPTCSCRMGAPDDPLAVTDAAGRVYGTDGLRVCDASLMPSIPCANTNVPTIMIAEKIADSIRSEVHSGR
ncbi:GMC family oxidoreductase [Lichenifustis flavocetrariae]|uniref:GMC family oxidoreductase N-terminal domain-containing protein n=1 Tax=Lichenifustis flavocetrariae TaxID=2949735 RepID=A0AA41Z8Y1_9HYPH|nr:GMC family oxidoreductase N-terminal domain-containing protein [Lichenifustis flavocetrariae]MCW6512683.1 GMC family oxidoreductase N-terminal domain-containing protein [Lichenifustis flavocetrariae]